MLISGKLEIMRSIHAFHPLHAKPSVTVIRDISQDGWTAHVRWAKRAMGQRLKPLLLVLSQSQWPFGASGSHLSLLHLRRTAAQLSSLISGTGDWQQSAQMRFASTVNHRVAANRGCTLPHCGPTPSVCATASETEAITQDHLRNQMIRAAGHAHTYPKIEFPFGREVQVNRRKDLLLLIAERIETRHGTHRAVVLESARNLGRQVITELEIG